MDARLERGGRGRPGAHLRPGEPASDDHVYMLAEALCRGACSARARAILDRFPGKRAGGRGLRAAVPVHPRECATARGATPSCPATSSPPSDGTGLVHTAIAFGEDDFRLGEQYGLTVDQPGPARRDLRRADRAVRRPQRQGRRLRPDRGPPRARPAAPGRDLRALLSALLALRHAAALLRQAVVVHRDQPGQGPAAGRQRDRQLAPEHVKHGRFGNWLENNVDWALSRERYWGTPLPVWRCENEPHPRDRLAAAELNELAGHERRPIRTARSSTTSTFAVRGAAASRCAACPR